MDPSVIEYPEVKSVLGYFIVGILAAYGLFGVLWAFFGWMLPKGEGCAICCIGAPEEGMLWRYRWLKALGFLDVPLLIVGEEMEQCDPDLEICSREEIIPRLKWERNRFDGTGNGDHTGRHQRRGVSEL